jgi:hypothetical protein
MQPGDLRAHADLVMRNFEIRSTQRQIGNGTTKTAVLCLHLLSPFT